ncbi:MAG: hypothetical protein AB7E47_15520 [Desulfovibrionaceae bacterium]
MSIIKSTVVTMSGMHMLEETLREDVALGRKLMVADKHASAFMWSLGTSNQYPSHVQGDSSPNAGYEQLAGHVADVVA